MLVACSVIIQAGTYIPLQALANTTCMCTVTAQHDVIIFCVVDSWCMYTCMCNV